MIAKAPAAQHRGDRVRGLLEYLYGPGRFEEHTNPHLVAAWDPTMLDAPQDKHGRGDLAAQLEYHRRIHQVTVRGGAIYHVPISLHAADGPRTDEQWRRVAERTADKLGFTAREGRAGCRWIAVHHGRTADGRDHIHFVADLVREDGRVASLGGDWAALREMREEMEVELGVTVRTGRNRNPERGWHRGERASAQRRGRPEPDRHDLARRVRAAAAGANTEAEFLTRLRRSGVLVRPRWAERQSAQQGQVVGYSVALRGQQGGPIWYGGGRLARDLTLPALRQRWGEPTSADRAAALGLWRPKHWRRTSAGRLDKQRRLRSGVWEAAGHQVALTRRRLAQLPAEDREAWAGVARETAGSFAALAGRLQPGQRRELAQASDALARAAAVPHGYRRGHRDPGLVAMSGVTRVATDAFLVSMGGGVAVAVLLRELAGLAADIARAHAAAERAAEAHAGARAAEHALAYTRTMPNPTPEAQAAALAETPTPERTPEDTRPRPVRRRPGEVAPERDWRSRQAGAPDWRQRGPGNGRGYGYGGGRGRDEFGR